MVVGIAKAARAKETEAIKDQIANFRGVFNAVELGGVQGIVILFIGLATATAGGLDVDVGQAEEALEGALGDGDLLKIGEAHREFLHLPNAAAEAEAAIGDDVPALFVVEADGRIGDEGDEEETRQGDDFDHGDDAKHPPRRAFGDVPEGEVDGDLGLAPGFAGRRLFRGDLRCIFGRRGECRGRAPVGRGGDFLGELFGPVEKPK